MQGKEVLTAYGDGTPSLIVSKQPAAPATLHAIYLKIPSVELSEPFVAASYIKGYLIFIY